MSGLDEKGLAAAANELLAHGEFSSIPSQNKPNAVIAAQEAIRAYLASATPADVGELVERLLHDHVQLGKMTEQASFLASGAVRVNDPSSLMADLRDAATALERVTRERDEAIDSCNNLILELSKSGTELSEENNRRVTAEAKLEQTTRERDEARAERDENFAEAKRVSSEYHALGKENLANHQKARAAEAKLAEALARLKTVEAETRELRARNDPMRVLGDPRVGVTIDEASLKELKRVLATIGGATP